MTREYPERPILAVGGVVFHGDHVLLIRRGKEPGKGGWSIPGGAVKLGESLREAVKREVLEETGLTVKPVSPVKVVEHIAPERSRIRYHYVIIDYACTFIRGKLEARSDAQEARWVVWDDLKGLGLPRQTLEVLELGRLGVRSHFLPFPVDRFPHL